MEESEVLAWQYCINKPFGKGDRTASHWLQQFMHSSSTDELRTAAHKKYNKLDLSVRGGVIYLFFTLTAMFKVSQDIKQAMLNYLDYFKNQGLARVVRDENILQAET